MPINIADFALIPRIGKTKLLIVCRKILVGNITFRRIQNENVCELQTQF